MSTKMIGNIKWFKENKGYGYINGYDEEVYYFEIINLETETENIKTGTKVKFIPNTQTEIPYADQIELYEE